eukprot:9493202-Pyramimonas_sp.AAC.1
MSRRLADCAATVVHQAQVEVPQHPQEGGEVAGELGARLRGAVPATACSAPGTDVLGKVQDEVQVVDASGRAPA